MIAARDKAYIGTVLAEPDSPPAPVLGMSSGICPKVASGARDSLKDPLRITSGTAAVSPSGLRFWTAVFAGSVALSPTPISLVPMIAFW